MFKDLRADGKNITWEAVQKTELVISLSHSLLVTMLSSMLLYDLEVSLIDNKSKVDFVFCDAPVILFNPYFNNKVPEGTNGFSCIGLQIILPISSRYLIIVYDPRCYAMKKLVRTNKAKDIQRLNGLQYILADKNIYFENRNQKGYLLERYTQIKAKRSSTKNSIETVGSHVDEKGNRRELVRATTRKFEYDLGKLSFIETAPEGIPVGIRNPRLVEINRILTDAVLDRKIKGHEEYVALAGKLLSDMPDEDI